MITSTWQGLLIALGLVAIIIFFKGCYEGGKEEDEGGKEEDE